MVYFGYLVILLTPFFHGLNNIQEKWIENCFICHLPIYKTVDIKESKSIQDWIHIIKSKTYSHLYLLTEKELQDCVDYFLNLKQDYLNYHLIINIYRLQN